MSSLERTVTRQQYSTKKIVLVALFPGVAMLVIGMLVPFLGSLADAVQIGFFFFAEACILLVIMYFLVRREESFSWKRAIPYQRPVKFRTFVLLLFGVTAYAVFFRDFFDWGSLNDLAMAVRRAAPFWPPSAGLYPGEVGDFTPSTSLGRIAYSVFIVLTIGAASAMQTVYFRGFLLPRMDRFGWWAPIFNNLLFVVFHLASPWFWGHFLIFTFLWGVITYATRNVWIAVVSHVIFNTYYDLGLIVSELVHLLKSHP